MTTRTWPRVLAFFAASFGIASGVANVQLAIHGRSMAAVFFVLREGNMTIPTALGALLGVVVAVLAVLAPSRRIPAAVPIAIASIPWLCGSLLALVAAASLGDVTTMDPAMRASAIAHAMAGVIDARLAGACVSAGLLGGVAGGWNWTAFAPVGERRVLRGLFVGIALALALALVQGIVVGIGGSLASGTTTLAVFFAFTALGAVLVFGSMARVDGDGRERVAPLVATAASAVALEAWAGIPMLTCGGAAQALGAIANADPSARGVMFARAAQELGSGALVLTLGPLIATVAAALFAWRLDPGALATTRARLGAAAVATVFALAIGAHVVSSIACRVMLSSIPGAPFDASMLIVP